MLAVLGATSTSAQAAFPTATIVGGNIGGTEIVVSDALAAGTWMVVDAQCFRRQLWRCRIEDFRSGVDSIRYRAGFSTDRLEQYRNLWQMNLTALIAERFFTVTKVRDNSVAVITGTDLGIGFSP